jgi:lipoprotein-anchoring transpeptidase ErfK/SrfK
MPFHRLLPNRSHSICDPLRAGGDAAYIRNAAQSHTIPGNGSHVRHDALRGVTGTGVATAGIPKEHPEYHYLEDVEYTQYLKEGGYAIHGNYWTPPSEFGDFTSNGCVGMLDTDAAWFWEHLSEGSMINIHL